VTTDNTPELSSHYLIFGLGPLSEPFIPDFDGLDKFDGEMYHSAKWPEQSVNFEGKNVGVIGTGSSGVQIIPEIAKTAEQLNVYQRTPNYVIPARNCERGEEFWKKTRENYDEIWEKVWNSQDGHPYDWEYETVEGLSDDEVQDVLEERWQQGGFRFFHTFQGLLNDKETNDRVCQFIESKVRERLDDKDLADKLIPEPDDHPYGAKRPPLSYDDYYQTYQRDNVNLIDVAEAPIEGFTKKGIETTKEHYEQDLIVLATGFDAITGAYKNIDIIGRNNSRIKEKWEDGPRTYLGFSVDEFPNMFIITGPQSVAALTNQPPAIEHQVNWITECIEYLENNNLRYIEANQESIDEWVKLSSYIAEQTLFTEADSWYIGANIPGKTRVFLPFLGGFPDFQDRVENIAENDYEGFKLAESVRGLRSSKINN
jgi:cation diffusion facilitator CzcD-associated flavoprotein CzcO